MKITSWELVLQDLIQTDVTLTLHSKGSRIVFGDLTPSSDVASPNRQESDVTWFLDPFYEFNSVNDYDIALLYLHTPVTFTDFVRPVCAYETVTSPETDSFPPELTELDNCYIAGWGALATGNEGKIKLAMKSVIYAIIAPGACYLITTRHTCSQSFGKDDICSTFFTCDLSPKQSHKKALLLNLCHRSQPHVI